MNILKINTVLAGLVCAGAVYAAAPQSRGVATLTATTPQGNTVTVTPMNDHILRITNTPAGIEAPVSRTTVLTPAKGVGAVDGNTLTLPSGVRATVAADGSLTISGAKGITVTDPGVRTVSDGKGVLALTVSDKKAAWYGAGERGHKFNLAGDTLVMYNRQNYGYTGDDPRISQMNITMPLVVSSDGYALLFDDYAASKLIMGDPIQYVTESKKPVTWYYVDGEGKLPVVSRQLADLTGHQNLPPFWALGYITSKYGYHDRAETVGVIDTLRTAGYPVDGIVLDLYWYGKEQDMGRLDWAPGQWPDHQEMLRQLKDDGVNLVAISQPYVLRNGRGLDNYNYLSERGMLAKDSVGGTAPVTIWVGEGGMLDVSNPETRAWLRERYGRLTDGGITGWWGDLGEPEVHPDGMVHANGLTTREYHNLYGNDWSEIIAELFAEKYPDRRLMTMMRGGTVGLQRFNVYPWSTDVSRSWGGLQPQVTIMLGSGMSGLGYMSHDVGGFAVDENNKYLPELYVRWLQLGTFSPILRTHAQYKAEPYNYPEQEKIIKRFIRERYEWLPYNYTAAAQNAMYGTPLVRTIGYGLDDNAAYAGVQDQYLWGDNLMVAPVLTEGSRERYVLFPGDSSTTWVDYNDPSLRYAGGTEAVVKAPLSQLPRFVRGNTAIPLSYNEMRDTRSYDPTWYALRYYPTSDGKYGIATIYEDDRVSPSSISRGEYAIIKVYADNDLTAKHITLRAELNGTYPGMDSKKTFTYQVYGIPAEPVVTDDTTGGKIDVTYSAKSQVAVFNAPLTSTVTLKW